jgi:photosystem II stability/assembly factor-like uncharacterized protein
MTQKYIRYFLLFTTAIHAPLVAQKAVKLNSSTFGQMEARAIGPAVMGGRISAIEGVNNDPRTIYVGAAGGGLWKSRTGGYSYEPVFDKYPQSIGAIAIDQKHPDTVWVGTGESNMRNSVAIGLGIYRSSDGGRNWMKMGLENSEHISKIIIHPNNSNTLYVAVPGKLWSDSPDRGLYKTTDGGKTWEKILYVDEKTGCADVLMDPRNPDVLWAASWQFRRTPYSFTSGGPGSALHKSTDGGKTWRKITNGLPTTAFGRIAMALAASAPDNLLAIVESEKTGLYISADGGESWKLQSASSNVTARPFYFSTLVVDPYEPKRVYRPAFSLSISNDGGYSFSDASNDGGWVHSDHHALWINPKNTQHMYLGTDGGVYMSIDRGITWSHQNILPVSQFYHVQVDNQIPYNVYGGLQDNGSWRGPSSSSGGIENRDWLGVGGGDGFWVQPDDQDNNIVYVESQGGNIQRQDLVTNQAQFIQPQALQGDPKLRWNWNTPIVKSPVNPKVLYMGSQFLYKTTDRGFSWTRISPDVTTNDTIKQKQADSGGLTVDNTSAENHCTIFAIAPSPLDENLLFVGTDDGNIQITRDGGKTWDLISKNITGVPAGTWVSSIEPSRFSKNVVYATFDNHAYGDMKSYAARSDDQGKTWTMLTGEGVQGYAHVIREDRVASNLLFLGTEFGLYVSNDGGKLWVLFKANLPEYVAVRDIVIHPRTNDLVLATHGRGVYIIDDISPLRLLTTELLQKDAAMLLTRPVAVTTGHYGQSFPNTGSYVGMNAPEEARVVYYLKDRISTGDVNLEVLDEKGNLLVTIPGTKRKGINVARWDLRLKPPKAAKGVMVQGEFGVFAGAIGPMAAPGKYTIRMKTPTATDERVLELIPDPLAPNLDYAKRQEQTQTMMAMVEELGFLEGRVKILRDSANQRATLVKNMKTKAKLTKYAEQLDAFRKTLTETIESKGITGEEQLRAKVGRIYVTTVLTDQPPTESTLKRMVFLQGEIERVKAQGEGFFTQLTSLNNDLKKEKIAPLAVLDKEAFLKAYDAPATMSKSGLMEAVKGVEKE